MNKKEWFTPAENGDGEIYSCMFSPDEAAPKGIVVIVHGMSGHSGQYTDFCEELCTLKFVTSAIDLQGHGKSQNHPGHFGNNGWFYMQTDLRNHISKVKETYPDIPVFLFGHSMGSFMARSYVVRFPKDVDALIISGTAGHSFTIYPVIAYVWLRRLFLGGSYVDMSIGKGMVIKYLRRIKNPINYYAWCSTDDQCCIEHAEDPLNVFFTLDSYYELFNSASKLRPDKWAVKVPKIPVYIFSGSEDPVGNYGKGPKEVYEWLQKTGHDTTLHIYEGYRHEMLWDKNKNDVRRTLYDWIKEKTSHIVI